MFLLHSEINGVIDLKVLIDELEDVPLLARKNMWLVHAKAAAHYSVALRDT